MLCECTPAELGMALTLQTPEQDKNNTYMYILPHRIYMYVRLMRSTHLHDVTTLFRGGDRGAGQGGGWDTTQLSLSNPFIHHQYCIWRNSIRLVPRPIPRSVAIVHGPWSWRWRVQWGKGVAYRNHPMNMR